MTHSPLLQARVRTLRHEAEGVLSVELVPADGTRFPAFSAGSHVDLHLPNGITRSYSLLNPADDIDRYVLGVLFDPTSRGGSRFVHESLRCATVLPISTPRNNFKLAEPAQRTREPEQSVLIAGGIGVTPILCMYRQLRAQGRAARVVYCARSRRQAAFLDEFAALGGDVELWFDDEHGGQPFDLASYLAAQPKHVHAYCCGPLPMLAAFEAACAASGLVNVHVERFAAAATATQAPTGGYVVHLKRSDRTLEVPDGQRLLDTLLAAGVSCDYSCGEGICGACETTVLDGEPEHRDCVLSEAEKATGRSMMICVSGAKNGGRLVLDL
ncbi:PDR/VanB family oxidoreductase [Paraburkholderia antibiotica]|uniref:Oxidoreductase n=1 Tax=Paraburkholderia antibiotica TaxID=2728839 RepID=A0A7Y0FGM5_9BURK|nr:PDR/VanB family oxidoreductase [Paraburkholderia antibiotica]NML35297.1 oxidoreductase [Paraburkholderia antibiotica]